jgi:hypothetical protein
VKQRETRNAAWVARHLNTSPQTIGRMIEEGRLQAYKLREYGPWHILMDSVRKLECELLTKAGVKESNAS